MPTPTYTPLATVTLGSSASSVTFSSIPATYRDLILIMNGAPQAAGDLWYRLNSDSGSNYPYVTMYGTGSAPVAGQGTTSYGVLTYNDSTGRFSVVASFMDYSATDKHKTVLSRGGQANAFVMAYATRWANTNAVTTLQVGMNGTNYLSGSTFSLYGIKA